MSKKLKSILSKKSGRSAGKIVVRHRGGRKKRFLRKIDYRRDKRDIWGKIESIEYDPNRNADIALVLYIDGERRYILSPLGLEKGQKIISSEAAPLEVGNTLSLDKIPAGSAIHNIEIRPGKGAQLVKSAGSVAIVQGKEEKYVLVKLPSGEIKRFDPKSLATLGQIGNVDYRTINIRKAGRKRRMGIRPTVRGVAQHPGSHPHGGGEGKSGVGLKYPKTYAGKPAVGKTRKKKEVFRSINNSKKKTGKTQLNVKKF